MVYLVYSIMKAPVICEAPLTGLSGQPVSFITAHGLGAAVSTLAAVVVAPPVAELLVYGRVVEELYRRQPVVPMRYGCFLEDLPSLQRHLEERVQQYDSLLKALAESAEMGIRILLPEGREKTPAETPPVDGGHYLARRQAHYRKQAANSRLHEALLHRYLQAFSVLDGKPRTEMAVRDGTVILSLYFLIPKNRVDRFRDIFHRVTEPDGSKILLSGPWPPYNFAVSREA